MTRTSDHLLAALDHLLAALALEGGLQELPDVDEALDTALGADSGVKRARRSAPDALQRIRGAEVGEDALLALEEAQNALAARCMEVGFRVGATVMNPAKQGGTR